MSTEYEKLFPQWAAMEKVADLSSVDFDALPFGAIRLDVDGKILRYNKKEGEISGLDPEAVIGKDFFTEVAPCTNVQEFAGEFRDGVAKKELSAVFPYHFDFKMEPTDVWVRLFYSEETESAWVFVSKRKESDG